MRRILPKILAVLTRHNRMLVEAGKDFEWSASSWTHNIFRVYELIFGRRDGIKAEISSWQRHGKNYQVAHSWEGSCALVETAIRGLFRKRVPIEVWIPVMQTPQGIPVFLSPYLFAIAWDAASGMQNNASSAGSPNSLSHTCTGSNLVLVVGTTGDSTTDHLTDIQYNSVSGTISQRKQYPSDRWQYLSIFTNPATGVHNIDTVGLVSWSQSGGTSYSGCAQSGQPDSSNNVNTTSTTSISVSTTVVATGCWLVGMIYSGYTSGSWTNATIRGTSFSTVGQAVVDSNATVGTGSQSLTGTGSPSASYVFVIMSIAPVAAASGSTSITSDLIFFN